MKTEPHQWLQRLVGEWAYEVEAKEPGKPPEKLEGSESVRSLGGIWGALRGPRRDARRRHGDNVDDSWV
jgi:Protein of unknown function (DUF1579)